MMPEFLRKYQPHLVLLGINLLLLAVLAAEWKFADLAHGRFEQSLQDKPSPQKLFGEFPNFHYELGGEDTYLDIVNHPLFLEGRLPVANDGGSDTPKPGVDKTNADLQLSLSGVVMTPDSLLALLNDKAGKSYRAKKGEAVQGWEVEEVANDKIVISNGTEQRTIFLRDFKAKGNPYSPAGARVPAAPLIPPQPPAAAQPVAAPVQAPEPPAAEDANDEQAVGEETDTDTDTDTDTGN